MEMKNLKPTEVFSFFDEICQVPRPPKKEEKIIAYLREFGEKYGLETLVDEAGNVLIKKPATKGMEGHKTVVLQAHIDMVCEKNKDVEHNFDTDPIETYIDGEWLRARGTTLGADNGIGMAAALAVLASDSIQHGPLECLFTVDEETGLTGAFALQSGFMNGDVLRFLGNMLQPLHDALLSCAAALRDGGELPDAECFRSFLNDCVVLGFGNNDDLRNVLALLKCEHAHTNDIGIAEGHENFIDAAHTGSVSGTHEDHRGIGCTGSSFRHGKPSFRY